MFKKKKPVRLTGEPLRKLVAAVYDRDGHCCILCGAWVQEGEKPHHVIFKSHGGGDTLDNLVLLCYKCHQKVHGGKDSRRLKTEILEYMRRFYEILD